MITDILFNFGPFILEKPKVATGIITSYGFNLAKYDYVVSTIGSETINLFIN